MADPVELPRAELANLPNAAALSGTETLPMQQGAGAVKVSVNFLFSRAAGQALPFEIGGQRVVTMTSAGVGFGTTTPSRRLEINSPTWGTHLRLTRPNTSTGSLDFASGNSNGVIVDYAQIYALPNDATAGSEKGSFVLSVRDRGSLRSAVWVTSDGRVGIGTGAPETGLAVRGTTPQSARIRIDGAAPDVGGSLDLSSEGSVFRLQGGKLGNGLGLIFEQVGIAERGRITGAGHLVWGPNGDTMQVSASGNAHAGVGLTADTLHVARSSSGPKAFIQTLNQTGTSTLLQFWYGSTSTGSITHTSTATAYNTSSDYRLPWKSGHTKLTGSGEFIDSLNPRYFPLVGHAGFIAHEFAEASPSSVTGEKDATDEGGNPVYQQMDPSSPDVMANVIAELQSLRRRVAVLEAAS